MIRAFRQEAPLFCAKCAGPAQTTFLFNTLRPEGIPSPPFVCLLVVHASSLLRFFLLIGGVSFFSKDLGLSLPEKQGKSQKEKAKKSQKQGNGDQGRSFCWPYDSRETVSRGRPSFAPGKWHSLPNKYAALPVTRDTHSVTVL